MIWNPADQPIKSRSQVFFGVGRQSDGPSFSRGFACVCGLYERHATPQGTLFDRRRPHDSRQAALRKAELKRLRATRVNNVLSVVIVVQMAMFLILDITRAHSSYKIKSLNTPALAATQGSLGARPRQQLWQVFVVDFYKPRCEAVFRFHSRLRLVQCRLEATQNECLKLFRGSPSTMARGRPCGAARSPSPESCA